MAEDGTAEHDDVFFAPIVIHDAASASSHFHPQVVSCDLLALRGSVEWNPETESAYNSKSNHPRVDLSSKSSNHSSGWRASVGSGEGIPVSPPEAPLPLPQSEASQAGKG